MYVRSYTAKQEQLIIREADYGWGPDHGWGPNHVIVLRGSGVHTNRESFPLVILGQSAALAVHVPTDA
jgi:hypothetical protein